MSPGGHGLQRPDSNILPRAHVVVEPRAEGRKMERVRRRGRKNDEGRICNVIGDECGGPGKCVIEER